MDDAVIANAIYDKYIAPTKRERDKYVGIEIEMPIINLNGDAVDFSVVHKLTHAFAKQFHMDPVGIDDEGNICSLQDSVQGDNLSYDCSYNNLEISMGKDKNIRVLADRFYRYYAFIEDFFRPYNYTLTGMGINPLRKINRCVPILNERYRMLFHYLGLYRNYSHPEFFHPYPDFGTFSSASQVQIDVNHRDLVDIINVFSKLEPVKALLFSNSVMPEEADLICVRDMLWENSMHGINLKNIGMFGRDLKNEADLFGYIKETSQYCTMRDGKYISFAPIPILDYYKRSHVTGEYWNGQAYEEITFEPDIADLKYHRTFKFQDLTFRGTVEFRSCCCQPIADSMTVAAFHVGLSETLGKLKTLLDNDHVLYGHGLSASELRKLLCHGRLPGFIDTDALQLLILSILDLATEGLEKRGYNEASFLEPLYSRAQQRTNPAQTYLSDLKKGVAIGELIRRYAKIN